MLKTRDRKLLLYCFGLDNPISVLVRTLVGEKNWKYSRLFCGWIKRKVPDSCEIRNFLTETTGLEPVTPACENASGRQSPAIRCFPALLVPVSADTNHCHVHCVHPLIFWYWSAYWSKPRPRRIRRSRGFFSKTNLVAEIVAWNGTIVKIFF